MLLIIGEPFYAALTLSCYVCDGITKSQGLNLGSIAHKLCEQVTGHHCASVSFSVKQEQNI
jgi:hypothetical protein